MGARSFTDLHVWKVSRRIVRAVYGLTRDFPQHEVIGLAGQMRRAAVSISNNIVEGFSRLGQKDKIRFYNVAQTSAEEVKNEVLLATDVGYCSPPADLMSDLDAVCAGLCRLIQSIQRTL